MHSKPLQEKPSRAPGERTAAPAGSGRATESGASPWTSASPSTAARLERSRCRPAPGAVQNPTKPSRPSPAARWSTTPPQADRSRKQRHRAGRRGVTPSPAGGSLAKTGVVGGPHPCDGFFAFGVCSAPRLAFLSFRFSAKGLARRARSTARADAGVRGRRIGGPSAVPPGGGRSGGLIGCCVARRQRAARRFGRAQGGRG